jgi:RNA polymerase sigma-70 factor (ECF subfamily)
MTVGPEGVRAGGEGDGALRDRFARARPELGVPADFGAALGGAFAAARAAWPGVDVPAEAFVLFFAAKVPAGGAAERALVELCTADLYLACACVRGDARAIARLDELVTSVSDRAAARLGASPERALEVRQRVRERVLMPRADPGGGPPAPRLASFSGRGSLRAWLKVVAVREAVVLLRRGRDEVAVENEALAGKLEPAAGPEVGYFKQFYREEFKAAFAEALGALSDRERTLLRQHALDGLSIDRLAALYRVHRATAARWVEAARRAALAHTRASLTRRLSLAPEEVDSVMRLVRSRFDVTLAPLLRENDGDGRAPDAPPAPGGPPDRGDR